MEPADLKLDAALAAVEDNIRRADVKATGLLGAEAILGPTLGLLTASGHAEPIATAVAAALLAAAMAAAVLALRPRTHNDDHASWPYWASLRPAQVDRALAPDTRRKRLISLSQLAERKMTALRWAADLTIAAVVALGLAAVLTVL